MAGPLKTLKVLDFTTLLPGPYATVYLADMGARVLKIASSTRPDMASLVPPYLDDTNLSFATAFLGRGKRCLALNLKDGRAVRIVHQLIKEYDIIVEQFRPGVMAKLGLDYESLKKTNPALIYCSLSGYGQTGPLKERAGHDINYLARSGLMSYSGRRDSGPSLMGMQIADVASGSHNAIIGILAAVVHRLATGEGQCIDISMTDGCVAFNALVGSSVLAGETAPGREEFLLNGGTLYDFYETADGRHLSFGGLEPHFFSAFCEAIGRPDLVAGGPAPQNASAVKEEVREILRSRSLDEWMSIFNGPDACVEPVLTLDEVLVDPHVVQRGLVVDVRLPRGGTVRQLANPLKFSRTPPEYGMAGVQAGTHTREVLRELGYADSQIDEFDKTGLFS
ncbi:MAG: CoA transferase [Syntrophales bacterium]|jgi:crotonobetainyl-CoA:carnitine CoA-transferase CaiB-like acyl-CoA transferase|nr:CoA transferase [Syntrophales bacterium]MCK9527934.1 CoA transferase [Syntrophales bacterium]MDX9921890.1 CaiB/BaiF CoA-transferase family protein [Syntrophales bacterium]